MNKYLGEFPVDVTTHPEYSKWTTADWAMLFISKYGGVDGAHHKTWVLDQVARILTGTPVIVVQARWESGEQEDRFIVAEPPNEVYTQWVTDIVNAGYDWDIGSAP